MTDNKNDSIQDLMEVVNSADIGLVILDKNYTVRVWNLFMVNHSGFSADSIIGKNLFGYFNDLPKQWFVDKAEKSISQKEKLLSLWEERPYLFKFKNTRNSSKAAAFMYQNITFIPLASASGEVNNFAITINDVTDIASGRQQLDAIVNEYEHNAKSDS